MPETCSARGCKGLIPAELTAEKKCVLHFTLAVEEECAQIRREMAYGNPSHERQVEFFGIISTRGETLVHIATSGFPMSDEAKARILSTLLTLINCRENVDRAASRQSAMRRFGD